MSEVLDEFLQAKTWHVLSYSVFSFNSSLFLVSTMFQFLL